MATRVFSSERSAAVLTAARIVRMTFPGIKADDVVASVLPGTDESAIGRNRDIVETVFGVLHCANRFPRLAVVFGDDAPLGDINNSFSINRQPAQWHLGINGRPLADELSIRIKDLNAATAVLADIDVAAGVHPMLRASVIMPGPMPSWPNSSSTLAKLFAASAAARSAGRGKAGFLKGAVTERIVEVTMPNTARMITNTKTMMMTGIISASETISLRLTPRRQD